MAAELIATTATKKVYRDGDKAIKVFNADFPKAEVLNEALITARVEETGGIDVPKVLEVGVFEGKWSITFDFIEGKTLQQLMDENPDKLAEYMEQMVDLHLNILSKHCPLLNKLKDKMSRQILETEELSDITRYDMRTKLDSMPKHTKLCHGDFNPAPCVFSTGYTQLRVTPVQMLPEPTFCSVCRIRKKLICIWISSVRRPVQPRSMCRHGCRS